MKNMLFILMGLALIGCDSFTTSNPTEPESQTTIVEKYKSGEFTLRMRFNINGPTRESIANGNHIVELEQCPDFELNVGYTQYRDNNTGLIWADGLVRLIPKSGYIYEASIGDNRAPIMGYSRSITLHEFIPPYPQSTKKYMIYYITQDNRNYAMGMVESKFYILTSSQSVTKAEVITIIRWKVNMEGGRDF